MACNIKQIVECYKNFVQTGHNYYEEEVFTKLEDALISEVGTDGTGIKIVHGGRSMVSYTGMKGKKCELADVRFLFYSPSRRKCRLVFLDFKKNKQYKKIGNMIKVQDDHYNMYFSIPRKKVYPVTRGLYIPTDILADHKHKFHRSCTMYAIIDSDVKKDYSVSFTVADKLINRGGIKYEYPVSSVVEISGNASFEYCTYIPGLEEFFEQAKEMRIGREIEFKDLHIVLGDMCEMMPDELKTLVPKSDNRDINIENKKFRIVNTIFLNVDELE